MRRAQNPANFREVAGHYRLDNAECEKRLNSNTSINQFVQLLSFCFKLFGEKQGIAMSVPVLLSDEEEWQKFKSGFNRSYEPEEETKCFAIFQENLKGIREHNEKFTKGEVSYTKGINNFADLTADEFKSRHTGLMRPQQ